MTDASSARAPRRAALTFIFVTVLLDMLAIGLIIPVLPNLVLAFQGGDTVSAAEIFGPLHFPVCAGQGTMQYRHLLEIISNAQGRDELINNKK